MTAVTFYVNATRPITEESLRAVLPKGTTVRAIPLPGFMLHDERSSISVRVWGEDQREWLDERLRALREAGLPRAILEGLGSDPLVVEVDLVKDERGSGLRHPLVRAIAKGFQAVVEDDDTIRDAKLRELVKAEPKRTSWQREMTIAWLGGVVPVRVDRTEDPLPDLHRNIVERIRRLPDDVRTWLEDFLFERLHDPKFRKAALNPPPKPPRPQDVWHVVYEPTVMVPAHPNEGDCFSVCFECTWDEEHGIEIVFDDRARPLSCGPQGELRPSAFGFSF